MNLKYEYLPLRRIQITNIQLATFGAGLGAICLIIGALPFIVIALPARFELKRVAKNHRELMNETGSVLLSTVEYVGGHPLLPFSGTCVLGLSSTSLRIYSIGGKHRFWDSFTTFLKMWEIKPEVEIPLMNILNTYTGRPKTAQEIYHEDYGTTIDVYQQSPFLNVVFEEGGNRFQVSFQNFDPWAVYDLRESGGLSETILSIWGLGDWKVQSPQDWHNLIVSLKYQGQVMRLP